MCKRLSFAAAAAVMAIGALLSGASSASAGGASWDRNGGGAGWDVSANSSTR
jgi:hypothetical protein